MAEKNHFNPMAVPDELKKTRNKLIFISLTVIFISVFEPSSTGFLDQFSIKVTYYPHIALWLLILIYLWFFIRYLSLLSYYFDFLNFLIHPIKSLKAIPALWQEFSYPIRSLEKKIKDFNEQYPPESDKLKHLKKLKSNWDEKARVTRTIRMIPSDTKDADEKAYLWIGEHENNQTELIYLKKRIVNLQSLSIMDILFPIILSLLTFVSIIFNYGQLITLITIE